MLSNEVLNIAPLIAQISIFTVLNSFWTFVEDCRLRAKRNFLFGTDVRAQNCDHVYNWFFRDAMSFAN
jgi:hypothetical protein